MHSFLNTISHKPLRACTRLKVCLHFANGSAGNSIAGISCFSPDTEARRRSASTASQSLRHDAHSASGKLVSSASSRMPFRSGRVAILEEPEQCGCKPQLDHHSRSLYIRPVRPPASRGPGGAVRFLRLHWVAGLFCSAPRRTRAAQRTAVKRFTGGAACIKGLLKNNLNNFVVCRRTSCTSIIV